MKWVRMDGDETNKDYSWYEDFNDPKAFFVDFFEGNWMTDDNDLLSMVLGMSNNRVRSYQVTHNTLGAYIVHNGRRYYVLAQN